MKIVGLTGGIGSGKTTVARMFTDIGIPVYDSDKEAKRLMRTSKKLQKEIIALFGAEAYEGKKLNKSYLADKVFADNGMLQKMNEVVHPAVRKHFLSWVKKQKSDYVIQESAIILEGGNRHFYDAIILVTAPQSLRLKRVGQRDNISPEKIVARMNHQMSDVKKIPLADFVIENVDLASTKQNVLAINRALLENS